jgi:hypothetical protein
MNRALNSCNLLILVGFTIIWTGCNSNNVTPEAITTESPATESVQDSIPDPFGDAVNKATAAADLTQTATKSEDWSNVANAWQQAIDLMKSVPQSSPNYEVAQQKANEYEANKTYAQNNAADIANVEQIYEDMLNAISTEDIGKINSLLAQGFNPNYQSRERTFLDQPYHVLAHAASFGTDAIVRKLIESGAKWDNIPSEVLSDALISASCQGQAFVVQELISAGADPNYSNSFGEKPLAMANSQTCRTLDKNGNPRQPGSSDHSKVVQLLQSAGAR